MHHLQREWEKLLETFGIEQAKTEESNTDCHILLDADLAILGAPALDYDSYAQAIRQEYRWVPEASYRTGRRQVLQAFLQRKRVTTQEGTRTEGKQGSQPKRLQAKARGHDLACAWWKCSRECDRRTELPTHLESSQTPFVGP